MTDATIAVKTVETTSGRIAYTETGAGAGPVALFVHGVLLSKHLWRHQLAELADIRRCVAVDLLAHGDTEIDENQDVSVTANANMLREFLDALQVDQVDIIGNDSGGGISQIFAALNPERVRSLILTNCDTHTNWPPEAFKPFIGQAAEGNSPRCSTRCWRTRPSTAHRRRSALHTRTPRASRTRTSTPT
jgi:pimeloyl-ACP methyl ester carboxylesterase